MLKKKYYTGLQIHEAIDGVVGDYQKAIEIYRRLAKMETDDVQPVTHGKWEKHVLKNANVPWGYDCSACGAWFVVGDDTLEKYHYCPNCGAQIQYMISFEEEE